MVKPAYWVISIVLVLVIFIVVMPSLIGILLSVILVLAVNDLHARRRRLAVRTFNSAVRAVCHKDGSVGKVAVAFSRTGPLSGACYDYARRLLLGENPVDAAGRSRIPLELPTAIALEHSGRSPRVDEPRPDRNLEFATEDPGSMPAYGQFLYLITAACCTCAALALIGLRVVPEIKMMLEEFGVERPSVWLLNSAPSVTILAVLGFVMLILAPILNRGEWLGIRFDRWIPILPAAAQRKRETLCGLADAMDAGMPLGRALAIGHSIAVDRGGRRSLETAMLAISQGLPAATALQDAGFVAPPQRLWLQETSPQRMAELFRVIAEQGVRDARSNLRWLMSILFPVVILALGGAVLAYSYGLLDALMALVSDLAKD